MNEYKHPPKDWWEQLNGVKHDWGELTDLAYYDGEIKQVRYCKTCGAMMWDWGKSNDDVYFESCRIMTNWPGDDAPCICTRRKYLEAHGIM